MESVAIPRHVGQHLSMGGIHQQSTSRHRIPQANWCLYVCVCVFVFASQGSLVSPPTIRAQHAIQVYMACAMVVVSTRQIGSGFVKGCAIHPAMRRFREVEYVWIFGVFKQMYVFE